MKNAWFAVCVAALGFAGCEATFVEPDPARDQRNIVLRHFYYFKGDLIDTNKVFALDGSGTQIRFKNIEMAMGFYHFENHLGDTVYPVKGDTTEFSVTSTSSLYDAFTRIYELPSGTYSGRHWWRIGLDSAQNAVPTTSWSPESPMNRLVRPNGGYNAVVIEGWWKSPTDTTQDKPYKPFKYTISSAAFNELLEYQSQFTVRKGRDVNVNIVFKANLLLENVDPALVDQIDIDPSNPLFYPLLPSFRLNLLKAYQIQL
jgi:hypothetical protein